MSATIHQGRAIFGRPSLPAQATMTRHRAVSVVGRLALVAALVGCGIALRVGYRGPSATLPNAYPTYAPGLKPQPMRSGQSAVDDAARSAWPLFGDTIWITKYPEPDRVAVLTGWLRDDERQRRIAMGQHAPLGRLIHLPSQ
jgi:hypothetical protein